MQSKYPYIPRFISNRINKLFKNFSCVVITGARQVGKSTLLQNLYPDIPCVVFDPVHDIQNARQDPELFLNNNRTGCRYVTVDAYNDPETINFYFKNDFLPLWDKDKDDPHSRILYFDLKPHNL